MKEKIKGLSGIFIALMALTLPVITIILFIKGTLWASKYILPFYPYVFWITLIIAIFIALPLAIIRRTKNFGSGVLYLLSYPISIIIWTLGFIYSYMFFGSFWVILGLVLGVIGVIPIGIFALIINGEWILLLELLALIFIFWGIRVLAPYLSENEGKRFFLFIIVVFILGLFIAFFSTNPKETAEKKFIKYLESEGFYCTESVCKIKYIYMGNPNVTSQIEAEEIINLKELSYEFIQLPVIDINGEMQYNNDYKYESSQKYFYNEDILINHEILYDAFDNSQYFFETKKSTCNNDSNYCNVKITEALNLKSQFLSYFKSGKVDINKFN